MFDTIKTGNPDKGIGLGNQNSCHQNKPFIWSGIMVELKHGPDYESLDCHMFSHNSFMEELTFLGFIQLLVQTNA